MYYYNDISLAKYCKEHGIKYNTIITGISKKKNNPKFKDYSEQEIVDMVVENYGKSIKYTYNGTTLRQYCLDKDISPETIYDRINELKRENSNLTNDELVRLSLEEYENKKIKYYYKGISLTEFCKNNSELSYSSIVDYIHRKKKDNPTLKDEDIIDLYLSEEHSRYRYYYQGIPLKIYCEENNISYKNVINYINKHKDDKDYINLTDNELIDKVMSKYQPFKPKYMYKNMTLFSYCKENNLPYYSIVSYINKKSRGKNMDNDQLIEEAIATINKYGIIYYYQGLPLRDYCAKNNLNVNSIRAAIWQKRKNSNNPLQEIVNECVESYKENNFKYFYKGEPLIQFCNKKGISYNTIVYRYLKSNESVSIERIVDDYIANPINRKKYYFDNMTLSKFCDKNGYPYYAIYQMVKRLENQEEYDDDIARIRNSLEKYAKKLQIKSIGDTFKNLENMKLYNSDEIQNICIFLKIDYNNVLELIEKGFSYIQAINMLWYFSDSKDELDNKIITDKKIEELFLLIDKISKTTSGNMDEFRLYDLIGLYKSKLYDTRNEILIRQQKHIYKIVYSMCDVYGIKGDKNVIDDFSSEVKLIFLEVINNICLNVEGQIIKYIDLTLKGNFRRYIERYQKSVPSISLDTPLFDNKKEKRIDYIADGKNQFEALENTFSDDMLQVLSSLSQEDLSFIILRYQENYDDEELSDYFKIGTDEIREKEVKILSLLKINLGKQFTKVYS